MKTKELLTQARDCAKNCDPKGLSVSGPNFKVTEYFRAPHLLGEVADRLEVVQEGYDQAISSSVTWEARAIKEASRAADLQAQVDELLAAANHLLSNAVFVNFSGEWNAVEDADLTGYCQPLQDVINKITGETK